MEKFEYPELGNKIKEIRGDMSQASFAKLLSVSQASVSKYEKGMKPEADVLVKIAKIGSTTVERLIGDNVLSETENKLPSIYNLSPFITEINDNYVKLTAYGITGAGNEMMEEGYEPIGDIVIPKNIYKSSYIPLKVEGDSMEKWIMDGSYVLVETAPQKRLIDKGIYCFRIPYSGYIIRLIHTEPDALYLEPVNKQYKIRKLGWASFEPDWIIGRVICTIVNKLVL